MKQSRRFRFVSGLVALDGMFSRAVEIDSVCERASCFFYFAKRVKIICRKG